MGITQLFIQPLKGEKSVTKATAILCVTKAIFKIKDIGKAHISVSLEACIHFAKRKNNRTIIITEFVKRRS